MDLREKITQALTRSFADPYVRLEEEDGISGFVVSPSFERMSSLDRQGQIEEALSTRPDPLTATEKRRVLMIAGLTPAEFDAVGIRIRVHRVKSVGSGAVEVLLRGRQPDAQYVRQALNTIEGVRTAEPEEPSGAVGVLMKIRASRKGATPLAKEEVLNALRGDPYIEVMPNA